MHSVSNSEAPQSHTVLSTNVTCLLSVCFINQKTINYISQCLVAFSDRRWHVSVIRDLLKQFRIILLLEIFGHVKCYGYLSHLWHIRRGHQCRESMKIFNGNWEFIQFTPYWQEEKEAIAQQIRHQKNMAPTTDPFHWHM